MTTFNPVLVPSKKKLEEIKNSNYNDLEDMVYRFQLTYEETIDTLDLKNIPTTTIGYSLPPGIYENIDINLMLKSLLPNEVKVNLKIDDVRLNSSLTTNKTIKLTEESFFYIILGFTQSHSGELGEIEVFVQFIPGFYKSDRPVDITGKDKMHLKCDCIQANK